MSAPLPGGANGDRSGPYEARLKEYCRVQGARPPVFQVVSDRRGGRTAWSCVVQLFGQSIKARFFYDGQRIDQAREDAAQEALQHFKQFASPPGTQPAAYGQPPVPQQQQQQPPRPYPQQQQQQQQPSPPQQQQQLQGMQQGYPQQGAPASQQESRYYGIIGR